MHWTVPISVDASKQAESPSVVREKLRTSMVFFASKLLKINMILALLLDTGSQPELHGTVVRKMITFLRAITLHHR